MVPVGLLCFPADRGSVCVNQKLQLCFGRGKRTVLRSELKMNLKHRRGILEGRKQPLGIVDVVEKGVILAVFSRDQIKTLHEDLMKGTVRSNRFFLWLNPSTSVSLKQHLKLRTLNFSDQQICKLLRVIEEVTGVGARIRRGEIRLLDFVFDVMLPEILISILEEGGVTRLTAELMMARGNPF